MFVFAREPARQRAAWQFLRFAASQRGFTIITSKQLPGLEPWLNWSKAKQGVQAESLLREGQPRIGYDVFCTNHQIGSMPAALVDESIRLFGQEVIPAFQRVPVGV